MFDIILYGLGRMWLWSKPCCRWQDCQLCQRKRGSTQGIEHRRKGRISLHKPGHYSSVKLYYFLLMLVNVILFSNVFIVNGFGIYSPLSTLASRNRNNSRSLLRRVTKENDGDNIDDGEYDDHDSNGQIYDNMDLDFNQNNDEELSTIPDLSWRVEKLRLEEANTRRFLKSKPRFLPYEECRKWVQAWNRWDSEEDWVTWIDEGEKRNSYIPARPDEYYGRLGKWKGWDHFLGKDCENVDNENNDFQ